MWHNYISYYCAALSFFTYIKFELNMLSILVFIHVVSWFGELSISGLCEEAFTSKEQSVRSVGR